MKPLTTEFVQSYFAHMLKHFDAQLIQRDADARVAQIHLNTFVGPVLQGVVATEVGKKAIRIMKASGF